VKYKQGQNTLSTQRIRIGKVLKGLENGSLQCLSYIFYGRKDSFLSTALIKGIQY